MSKKEPNLISSPVLRAFYEKAVKNNWISEEKIEKTASVNKFAASGNLMLDLVSLASGLRELGLYSHAEELESKIASFKKAEINYYNLIDSESRKLLDFAHSDSTKIIDAQNGWGVVHTDLDRQRKILESVNRQPKGSHQVIQNAVIAAADALGLMKYAQDTGLDIEEESSEPSSDILLDDENKKKVKNIQSAVSSAVESISKNLDTAEQYYSNMSNDASLFNDSSFIENPNSAKAQYYFNKSNINYKDFSNFITMKNFFGGIDANNIMKIISSSDYNSLNSSLSFLPDNFKNKLYGSKYFIPDLLSSLFSFNQKQAINEARVSIQKNINEGDTRYAYNANSIWEGVITPYTTPDKINFSSFYMNQVAAYDLAAEISAYLKAQWASFFNEEALLKAASALASSKTFSGVKAAFNKIRNKLSEITPEVKTTGQFIEKLQSILETANIILSGLGKDKNLASIATTYVTAFLGAANNIALSANHAIKVLEKNMLNPELDKLVDSGKVSQITNNLVVAANTLNKYKASAPEKEQKVLQDNLTKITLIYEAVRLNYKSSWSTLKDALSKEGLSVKTLDDAVAISNNIKAQILSQVPEQYHFKAKDQSQANDGLNKSAKLSPLQFGATPAKPSTKPSAKPIHSGKTSNTPMEAKNLTDGQKSVQKMQLALSQLANFLSKTEPNDSTALKKVGPGKNLSDFDGKWGPNTAAALTVAKKYTSEISEVGPMMGKSDDEIKSAADKNTNSLISFFKSRNFSDALAALQIQEAKILDKIDPELKKDNISEFNITNGVEISSFDLSSLKNFYNFARKKLQLDALLKQNLTVLEWNNIFSYIYHRAKQLHTLSTNSKLKRNYFEYTKLVSSLWNKFAAQLRALGLDLKSNYNMEIDEGDFTSENPTPITDSKDVIGYGGAGLPQSKEEKELSVNRYTGKSINQMDLPETPSQQIKHPVPFDDKTIGLELADEKGNPWFNLGVLAFKTSFPVSLFNDNAINVAQRLFSKSVSTPQLMQPLYINMFGQALKTSYDEESGGYFAKDPADGVNKSISSFKDYQEKLPYLLNLGAVSEYYGFLNNLLPQLTNAMNKLREDKPAAFMQSMDRAHSKIVQGINNHLSQINRYLRMLRK